MKKSRFRSPLARAFVPVVGGILFFSLFFLGLWGAATYITDRAEPNSLVTNKVFEVGKVTALAKSVATNGPILLPDLQSPDGLRSIVLDHTGDDPANGWRVYLGFPADKPVTCLVEQITNTREFTDCDGRTVSVDDLQTPNNVRPVVENRTTLFIDLRGITDAIDTTVP